jgi:PAS domain S-box-containing protein
LAAARLIGETDTDIVLQFRAVRLLIAEDQLAAVRREIRISDTPTVVADPTGAILLSNEAFGRLLGGAQAKLARLEDLAPLFTHAGEFRDRLDELFAKRRPWRGEVSLLKPSGTSLPLLVRADAVLSPDGGNLGFLLLFSDQTTHKEAERARLRFQEDIVERQALRTQRLDSASDLLYRKLLASIVENAQLAALEITDGMDITDIPALLEGLRISVARTAETLEQLIRQVRAGKR